MSHSDIALQVMWNRLISVVEEQALALVRTAFSTSVREAGDLSAGVYDLDGLMLAQAVTGTPGHVNAMAESVKHFMREIGVENMVEGDVYITNDPWMGTGHLHDITVVTPSFHQGRHVGYFACTAHVVDIGGRGFTADGESVYEEGLRIPIMHFARAGEVNFDVVKFVRANVREADQVVGDIYALAACNETGHRRLVAMLDEFGLPDLTEIAAFHPGKLAPGDHREDRGAAPGLDHQRDDHRRLRRADHAAGAPRHQRGPHRRRLRRHLAALAQGHQRAARLHPGLCLLRPEMRHRARDPEQRGQPRALPHHRAQGLDPERRGPGARLPPPHHGPHDPRHGAGRAAQDPARHGAGRGLRRALQLPALVPPAARRQFRPRRPARRGA